jgi:hypothetical protein
VLPGKGTAKDEKEKDKALTELLMDFIWDEQMPSDRVTSE